MPSFNCPRRHRDKRGEPAGYCRGATRSPGAAAPASSLASCSLDLTGWPHPCTSYSTERGRVISRDGGEAGALLCASHKDALRGGGALWMLGSGLLLVFVGARDEA
jgi:hypothetical protein